MYASRISAKILRKFSRSIVPSRKSTRTSLESSKDTFYVTTPIYYVNANPHIGHLYSSLIADTIYRWRGLIDKGSRIKFATGTDEHGSKIAQAAFSKGQVPMEYCDKICTSYQNLTQDFEINYTDFTRTTEETHKKTVHKFWKVLYENGHIYSADYEGWYCVSDETFLSKSQLKEIVNADGTKTLVSEESGHSVEWTKEKNYIFKLSSFQDDLIHWLNNEERVKPKKFYKILLKMVTEAPLCDLSISRSATRVNWGIPVPSDPSQTIYVWMDALVNYLTAAGYGDDTVNFKNVWPPDVHVIGKDILKFHGIYWPAFLMAANLEPPRSLLCHSHWTVASEKMSKSKGNVVDPFDRANIFTADGLRYFLLRAGVPRTDGNFNDGKVMRILNAELADTLGNLLNRCTSEALNPNQEFPAFDQMTLEEMMSEEFTQKLIKNVSLLPHTCKLHYNEYNFYKAMDSIIATLHSANLFFEMMKPWELKKSEEQRDKLNVVLHLTIETLRIVGILLQPVIPNLATMLLDKLDVEEDSRFFENLEQVSWKDPKFCSRPLSQDRLVLFRRIDKKKKKERN